VNVIGTQNILEAARRHAPRRVLLTSTSEVYGTAQEIPIHETHRLHPQSPYAASKVAADQLGLSYHRSFGTPVVVVRPFNTFGPRQSSRAVIPTIVSQLIGRDDSTLELGDTSPRRDLLYVADTVRGFRMLAEADDREVLGETFNLATGRSVSIGELARMAAELVGKPDIQIVRRTERIRPKESEVHYLEGDATLIRERIGWSPEHDLRSGLAHVIDYIRRTPPDDLAYRT
jgi:nucleoside-diphosphate-sugar epimerase